MFINEIKKIKGLETIEEYNHIENPCIYFLFNEETLVYIGQTTDLPTRISRHKKTGKEFTRVFYICVDKKDLLFMENHFVKLLTPPGQKPLNISRRTEEEQRRYELEKLKFKRLIAEANREYNLELEEKRNRSNDSLRTIT